MLNYMPESVIVPAGPTNVGFVPVCATLMIPTCHRIIEVDVKIYITVNDPLLEMIVENYELLDAGDIPETFELIKENFSDVLLDIVNRSKYNTIDDLCAAIARKTNNSKINISQRIYRIFASNEIQLIHDTNKNVSYRY